MALDKLDEERDPRSDDEDDRFTIRMDDLCGAAAELCRGEPLERVTDPAADRKAWLDGLSVELYRSEIDGRIVIDVVSDELDDADTLGPHSVPRVRLMVNECIEDMQPSGKWKDVTNG